MENYATITESYSLPSRGLVYSPKINPTGLVRGMTVADEMRRLSPSERQYQNMASIIDDCILEDIGMSSYDMCIADYQYLLQRVLVATYGPEYKFEVRCPFCGETYVKELNMDELGITQFDPDKPVEDEFTLPRTGKRIKLRMQTPRLLDDMIERSNAIKAKTDGTINQSLMLAVTGLVELVDGRPMNAVALEAFARKLPLMDANYLLNKAGKIEDSFGLNLNVECDCPHCKLHSVAPFRISSVFFRPKVD